MRSIGTCGQPAGWFVAVGGIGLATACTPKPQTTQGAEGSQLAPLTVTSTFGEGQPIPAENACSVPKKNDCDLGLSPRLTWTTGPPQTASYALLVCDPDGHNWLHWVATDIPASVTQLAAGVSGHCASQLPAGAKDGKNEFGTSGYGGPCPPAGSGVHHYIFTVYGLKSSQAAIPQATSCGAVQEALESQAIAKGTLTGTYRIDR